MKSHMKSYCGMISYMILYASPGRFIPVQWRPLPVQIQLGSNRIEPLLVPFVVSLFSVVRKSGCSGLLVLIRHSAQCARIPLPRSLFLIDLFAALHLATSMARRMLSDFGSA